MVLWMHLFGRKNITSFGTAFFVLKLCKSWRSLLREVKGPCSLHSEHKVPIIIYLFKKGWNNMVLNTSAILMFAARFSSACNSEQFVLDLVLLWLNLENVPVGNFLDLLAASHFVSWPFCFFPFSKVYFLTFVMRIFHVLCHSLPCFGSLKSFGFPQVCLSLKWAHFLHTAIKCICVINSFTLATCADSAAHWRPEVLKVALYLSLFYSSLPFPSQKMSSDQCLFSLPSSFL